MAQNGNVSTVNNEKRNVASNEVVQISSSDDEEVVCIASKNDQNSIKRKLIHTEENKQNKIQKVSPESIGSSPQIETNKGPLTTDNGTEEKKDSETSDSKSVSSLEPRSQEKTSKPLLEKYWSVVKNDPSDFTGWTYLLQYIEQEDDVDSATNVFDDFLSKYPFCYGYWRKYADYFNKRGFKDKCEQVFQRGITAIPLSIDLWIHYLNFMRSTHTDDIDLLIKLYEQALSICGLDFRSDRLWDSYVSYMVEKSRLKEATDIFDRWLAVPTQGYLTVLEKFKNHVKKSSPNAILSANDFFLMRNKLLTDNKFEKKGCILSDDAPPGEETPDMLDKLDEQETSAMRDKIISFREKIHKMTTKEVLSRLRFEEAIKRPYFHVKPLEPTQLKNWDEYLKFEIEQGKQDRIMVLFERCLIACALYDAYWTKYIRYLNSLKSPDMKSKIHEVFTLGCTVYHKNKINLNMEWATFEEATGNRDMAAEILEKLDNLNPGVMCVMNRRIYLEARRKNTDKSCSLYEQYINDDRIKSQYIQELYKTYATFCAKVLNDVPKAVSILQKALNKYKESTALYLNLIDVHFFKPEINVDEVDAIFNEVLNISDLPLEKKLLFSQRKADFLLEFSDDITRIQKAKKLSMEFLSEYQSGENKPALAEKRSMRNEKEHMLEKQPYSNEEDIFPPGVASILGLNTNSNNDVDDKSSESINLQNISTVNNYENLKFAENENFPSNTLTERTGNQKENKFDDINVPIKVLKKDGDDKGEQPIQCSLNTPAMNQNEQKLLSLVKSFIGYFSIPRYLAITEQVVNQRDIDRVKKLFAEKIDLSKILSIEIKLLKCKFYCDAFIYVEDNEALQTLALYEYQIDDHVFAVHIVNELPNSLVENEESGCALGCIPELSFSVTNNDITECLEQNAGIGNVLKVKPLRFKKAKKRMLIYFADRPSLLKVIEPGNYKINEHDFIIREAMEQERNIHLYRCVYSGVPSDTTSMELKTTIESTIGEGSIKIVQFMFQNRTVAYVTFNDERSLQKAISGNFLIIVNSRSLNVSLFTVHGSGVSTPYINDRSNFVGQVNCIPKSIPVSKLKELFNARVGPPNIFSIEMRTRKVGKVSVRKAIISVKNKDVLNTLTSCEYKLDDHVIVVKEKKVLPIQNVKNSEVKEKHKITVNSLNTLMSKNIAFNKTASDIFVKKRSPQNGKENIAKERRYSNESEDIFAHGVTSATKNVDVLRLNKKSNYNVNDTSSKDMVLENMLTVNNDENFKFDQNEKVSEEGSENEKKRKMDDINVSVKMLKRNENDIDEQKENSVTSGLNTATKNQNKLTFFSAVRSFIGCFSIPRYLAITEQAINQLGIDKLKKLFAEKIDFSKILSLEIKLLKHKGYCNAFIYVEDNDALQTLALYEYQIDDHIFGVNVVNEPPNTLVENECGGAIGSISWLPLSVTDNDIIKCLEQNAGIGNVLRVKPFRFKKDTKRVLVYFADRPSLLKVIETDQYKINEHDFTIKEASVHKRNTHLYRCVYSAIPIDTSSLELKCIIESTIGEGSIKDVEFMFQNRTVAYATFNDERSLQKALSGNFPVTVNSISLTVTLFTVHGTGVSTPNTIEGWDFVGLVRRIPKNVCINKLKQLFYAKVGASNILSVDIRTRKRREWFRTVFIYLKNKDVLKTLTSCEYRVDDHVIMVEVKNEFEAKDKKIEDQKKTELGDANIPLKLLKTNEDYNEDNSITSNSNTASEIQNESTFLSPVISFIGYFSIPRYLAINEQAVNEIGIDRIKKLFAEKISLSKILSIEIKLLKCKFYCDAFVYVANNDALQTLALYEYQIDNHVFAVHAVNEPPNPLVENEEYGGAIGCIPRLSLCVSNIDVIECLEQNAGIGNVLRVKPLRFKTETYIATKDMLVYFADRVSLLIVIAIGKYNINDHNFIIREAWEHERNICLYRCVYWAIPSDTSHLKLQNMIESTIGEGSIKDVEFMFQNETVAYVTFNDERSLQKAVSGYFPVTVDSGSLYTTLFTVCGSGVSTPNTSDLCSNTNESWSFVGVVRHVPENVSFNKLKEVFDAQVGASNILSIELKALKTYPKFRNATILVKNEDTLNILTSCVYRMYNHLITVEGMKHFELYKGKKNEIKEKRDITAKSSNTSLLNDILVYKIVSVDFVGSSFVAYVPYIPQNLSFTSLIELISEKVDASKILCVEIKSRKMCLNIYYALIYLGDNDALITLSSCKYRFNGSTLILRVSPEPYVLKQEYNLRGAVGIIHNLTLTISDKDVIKCLELNVGIGKVIEIAPKSFLERESRTLLICFANEYTLLEVILYGPYYINGHYIWVRRASPLPKFAGSEIPRDAMQFNSKSALESTIDDIKDVGVTSGNKSKQSLQRASFGEFPIIPECLKVSAFNECELHNGNSSSSNQSIKHDNKLNSVSQCNNKLETCDARKSEAVLEAKKNVEIDVLLPSSFIGIVRDAPRCLTAVWLKKLLAEKIDISKVLHIEPVVTRQNQVNMYIFVNDHDTLHTLTLYEYKTNDNVFVVTIENDKTECQEESFGSLGFISELPLEITDKDSMEYLEVLIGIRKIIKVKSCDFQIKKNIAIRRLLVYFSDESSLLEAIKIGQFMLHGHCFVIRKSIITNKNKNEGEIDIGIKNPLRILEVNERKNDDGEEKMDVSISSENQVERKTAMECTTKTAKEVDVNETEINCFIGYIREVPENLSVDQLSELLSEKVDRSKILKVEMLSHKRNNFRYAFIYVEDRDTLETLTSFQYRTGDDALVVRIVNGRSEISQEELSGALAYIPQIPLNITDEDVIKCLESYVGIGKIIKIIRKRFSKPKAMRDLIIGFADKASLLEVIETGEYVIKGHGFMIREALESDSKIKLYRVMYFTIPVNTTQLEFEAAVRCTFGDETIKNAKLMFKYPTYGYVTFNDEDSLRKALSREFSVTINSIPLKATAFNPGTS